METAGDMFKIELTALFKRWGEESYLDVMEMAECTVSVINKICNEPAIDFEPDEEFLDKLDEEKE